MALLLIVFLTAVLSAAFANASSEARISDNASDQAKAFSLAQSGLELFLVSRDSLGFSGAPAAVESIQVTLDGGYADVVMRRVRPSVNGANRLYAIRSSGVVTDPDEPGVPQAVRTVSSYARWSVAGVGAQAAWTTLTGFHKNGTSGLITGVNQCGSGGDVAGIATADPPGYTQSGGNKSPLKGSPPLLGLGGYGSAASTVPFEWEPIVNMENITPDIVIPGDAFPTVYDSDYWPVIHITGDMLIDFTLVGQGLLIVTGTLILDGDVEWDGIILAGDHVTGNGTNSIDGAVYSGLNVLLGDPDVLGPTIGTNDIGNGTKRIYYDECNIARALANFGGLAVWEDAWTDNWAQY